MIGEAEFVMGKPFWEMVAKNDALYSAKGDLQVTASQELLYRGKKVDLGAGVKYVDSALQGSYRFLSSVVAEPLRIYSR